MIRHHIFHYDIAIAGGTRNISRRKKGAAEAAPFLVIPAFAGEA
jgi:hypothetical protein